MDIFLAEFINQTVKMPTSHKNKSAVKLLFGVKSKGAEYFVYQAARRKSPNEYVVYNKGGSRAEFIGEFSLVESMLYN